jgi:hypothetical protein
MTDPDRYGVTSSEDRDLGDPQGPLDHALAEILTTAAAILKRHGIHHHRLAIIVDDLVHGSPVEGSTQGGMVLSLPAAEDMQDVLALIFSHVMALAETQDIPIAQVAANVMFGGLPHSAVEAEDVAHITDTLRAVCQGTGARLLEDPILKDGEDPALADCSLRRAAGVVLMSAAAVTFAETTRQLLEAAGVTDGADGSEPPPGWPEGLRWGTD